MDKPFIYSPIPEFNQETQYVTQIDPVDMGDYIFVGIAVRASESAIADDLEDLLIAEMGA
jgi:hypothetical protein